MRRISIVGALLGLSVGCGEPPEQVARDATASSSDAQRLEDGHADAGNDGTTWFGAGAARIPAGPFFVDVTAEAGLELDPGELVYAPHCLLDWVDGPGPGDYCLPERFIGAVAVGDYDNDGWPDLYVTRLAGPGVLMRNEGDGSFRDVTAIVGLQHSDVTAGAAWLDIEGDGDLDLLLTSFGGTRHYLYINDGAGQFDERALLHGVDVTTGAVHVGTSIAVGDYDLDGYVDVFVGDWRSTNALGPGPDHNRLLHNLGAAAPGHYEDVTEAMGISLYDGAPPPGTPPGAFGFAPAFVDLDGDHWPELVIAADYGTSRLYWNNGGGAFEDGTAAAGVQNDAHGMGSALGDYDGDGDLDWFISGIHAPPGGTGNRLFRNDGDRTFVDTTDERGVRDGGWGWGAAFFDADHDGHLDLALASGWPSPTFGSDPVRLWLGGRAGAWSEVAGSLGISFQRGGRGLVPIDYDRDGDLDLLVISNTEAPALYRNDGAAGGWLVVRAQGDGGNSRGIGVEVRVQTVAGGAWQVRHIGVGSHLFGQEDARAHFGLGPGSDRIHLVEVYWPSSGRHRQLTQVPRNQVLVVAE